MNVKTSLTIIVASGLAQLYFLIATASLVKDRLVVLEDYTLSDSPMLDMDMTRWGWSTIKCSLICQQMTSCKSLSIKKDLSRFVVIAYFVIFRVDPQIKEIQLNIRVFRFQHKSDISVQN